MGALHLARRKGLEVEEADWLVQRSMLEHLETIWQQPDEGIWEVRGPPRHFTHSKVMAWVAFDRGVKDALRFGLEGPIDRWQAARDAVHAQVCEKGFDRERNTFIQHYGSTDLDASLLMIPLVGFLPASDPRVVGTVAAIEPDLLKDGFVARYPTHQGVDGLPPGEGAFLPCTFWLADAWSLIGRTDEARQLFERLLGLCNDVGLISEEYDAQAKRLLGNFPQAFTHVGLVNTALNLSHPNGPAADRHDAGVRKS
jgi:GH15 family glucan-1,4-alpha-glucosidase